MLYREKNDIIEWLDKYNIRNYTLQLDETYGYLVDVDGSVELDNTHIKKIAVQFGSIKSYFECSNNELTSLEGAPHTVGGYFDCCGNKLTSLKGAPHTIGNDFYCSDNQLTSLEGSPCHVGGSFFCSNNQLTSLKGVSESIAEEFYCVGNRKLQELELITDFNEIKAYLLAEKLANDLNIKYNKRKVKL